MLKIRLADKRIFKIFLQISSMFSTALATLFLFIDIPSNCKPVGLGIFFVTLSVIYLSVWIWANHLKQINIMIEGSNVTIKTGDIFREPGLKVIAFNEYFDTQVDNTLISEVSLNGFFIQNHLDIEASKLDDLINSYPFELDEIIEDNCQRSSGKKRKYKLGTIFSYKDFLLTAFSKFDASNRAYLTMPDYLEFLINLWDSVNKIYAQRSVATTIFGSGITRINGHKNITDEDLLKIMLWTFRISEMRFKYPAKLTILIHESKIDQINLFELLSVKEVI